MRTLNTILAYAVGGLAGAAFTVVVPHFWGVTTVGYPNSYAVHYLMWGGGLLIAYGTATLLKRWHH